MPLQENSSRINVPKYPPLPSASVRPPSEILQASTDWAQPTSDGASPIKNRSPPKSCTPVMRTKTRSATVSPIPLKIHACNSEKLTNGEGLAIAQVDAPLKMTQVNGIMRDQTPLDLQRPPNGRVISASMMRSASTFSAIEQSPSSDTVAWSSAIGHASTGKSGRVIERLQGDIDRLHREKHLLKMRHEEVEKANEALTTRNQYLQDRNSNQEHSHDANARQMARKERQVEDLREELRKERLRTIRAEEQAQAASASEEDWRDQASQAKAMATQRESEYEAIVSCRNMDNDRHQHGLDKIRGSFETLMRQREEDVDKHKKLEIIAEQQKQTIGQLEELTKRLNANFRAYRSEIDTAIAGLRDNASSNGTAMTRKLSEMTEVTGQMRWIMSVEEVVNHRPSKPHDAVVVTTQETELPEPQRQKSTTRTMLTKHKRHRSKPVS